MNTQSPSLRHPPDQRLLVWAASGILGIVFVGFARSYFLKFLFDSPPLPWLVHLHGAVMTSWFVLFFAQTCLIARHRVHLHRRLGAVGAALAVAMIVLGIIVVTYAAAREVHAHSKHAPFFLMLLAFDPFVLLVFAALVTGAIAMRNRRGDMHKRLMLLATLSLTPLAIGRLPFPSEGIFWLVYALWLFTPVAVDTVRHHRLHPVLTNVASSRNSLHIVPAAEGSMYFRRRGYLVTRLNSSSCSSLVSSSKRPSRHARYRRSEGPSGVMRALQRILVSRMTLIHRAGRTARHAPRQVPHR